jgi:hypothetical protein
MCFVGLLYAETIQTGYSHCPYTIETFNFSWIPSERYILVAWAQTKLFALPRNHENAMSVPPGNHLNAVSNLPGNHLNILSTLHGNDPNVLVTLSEYCVKTLLMLFRNN